MAKITFELLGEEKRTFEFDRPIDFRLICAHHIDAGPSTEKNAFVIILKYDPVERPFFIMGSRWACVDVIDFAIREMYCLEYDDMCEILVKSSPLEDFQELFEIPPFKM